MKGNSQTPFKNLETELLANNEILKDLRNNYKKGKYGNIGNY
jgi:hypothetical protein